MGVAVTAEGADRNARARVCRFDADLGYRVLPGRHHGECDGGLGDCDGCQMCAERHCVVCNREHVDRQTCARCVGNIRDDLGAIWARYADLPAQAEAKPSADIPGGMAQVLLGPYSEGREALRLGLRAGDWTELDDDGIGPEPPLLVLATWEDDWRDEFGHGAGPTATIERAVDYLHKHLARAAQEHLAFEEFAQDVRTTRARLEAACDDADPTVHGVACFDCGADLRQQFDQPRPCQHDDAPCGCDQGGRRDTWECSRCGRTYTEPDYRRAVRQAHIEQRPLRTASEVHAITGVLPATLRQWVRRGQISQHRDGRRVRYDVAEVRRHAMRGGLLAGTA